MPDRKSSERTREKIKDAFLTLYEKDGIEKISIRKLTDLAGVNRSTFYSYYLDIYDLFDQLVDEKYRILYDKLSKAVPVAISGENFKDYIPDEEFFVENEKWMVILVGMHGKSDIIERVKESIKIVICDNLGIDLDQLSPEMGYAVEHLISANAGTLTKWIRNGRDIEINELVKIIAYSMMNGPIKTLTELKFRETKSK